MSLRLSLLELPVKAVDLLVLFSELLPIYRKISEYLPKNKFVVEPFTGMGPIQEPTG